MLEVYWLGDFRGAFPEKLLVSKTSMEVDSLSDQE